jgi:hypothetical protein
MWRAQLTHTQKVPFIGGYFIKEVHPADNVRAFSSNAWDTFNLTTFNSPSKLLTMLEGFHRCREGWPVVELTV